MNPQEIMLTVFIILGICGVAAFIFAMVVFGNQSPWDPDL